MIVATGCRRRGGFTLIELLVVIAIIGVLIALLLPAVQASRSAARRMTCVSNMMQNALALHNYESTYETLPPGVVNATGPIINTNSGYHYGWLVQILPYIEHKNVFNHLNFQVGLYDAANTSARSVTISIYQCPSDGNVSATNQTSYFGCHNDVEAPIDVTNNGVLYLNSRIRTEDLEDGASQTIAFGEALANTPSFGWASGTRSSLRNTGTLINAPMPVATAANPIPVGNYSSMHPGGANFAFADGSVRFLKSTLNAGVLRLLGNRHDGDLLNDGSY